jgi:hypothetical protein
MSTTSRDAKEFLQNILLSGKGAFVLPESSALSEDIMKELGPGFSRMGDTVRISATKRQELRARLIDDLGRGHNR